MTRTDSSVAIVLSVVLASVVAANAGEAEMARVKSEWPVASRHIDEVFSRVRGQAALRMERPGPKEKTNITEAHFAVDHGMEKVEIFRYPENENTRPAKNTRPARPTTSVYCVGSDTAFELARGEGKETYTVKGIGTTQKERYRYLSGFGRFLAAPNAVSGQPITEFLEESGRELISAEPLNENGKALIKTDFKSRSGDDESRVSIVVDPQAGWVVRSCEYHLVKTPSDSTSYKIEYGSAFHEGVALPSRVELRDAGVIHHCEFKDWSFDSTPISEFSMAYYGLPDLVEANRRAGDLPYWLAGGAVLAGVVAYGLWRLARTSSSTT